MEVKSYQFKSNVINAEINTQIKEWLAEDHLHVGGLQLAILLLMSIMCVMYVYLLLWKSMVRRYIIVAEMFINMPCNQLVCFLFSRTHVRVVATHCIICSLGYGHHDVMGGRHSQLC